MKLVWFMFALVCLPFLGSAQEVTKENNYGIDTTFWYPDGEKETRMRVVEEFKPGTKLPDFKFEDIDGKTVSLKAFKGKYVYIDVWATYCGPCLNELPRLHELEKAMAGKNIVFVSISKDPERKDWEKMVKEKKMKGVQWFIGKDKKFKEALGITLIPRFILVNRKGRIVEAYMSRPSNPATLKVLQALKGI